jgi:hypothetical protein
LLKKLSGFLQVQSMATCASRGSNSLEQMLSSLRRLQDERREVLAEMASTLTPLLIDLGKHVMVKPSVHPSHGHIVTVQQARARSSLCYK